MKKMILIFGIVAFPAIASANFLFENYTMTLNPVAGMAFLGIGLLSAARIVRQTLEDKSN